MPPTPPPFVVSAEPKAVPAAAPPAPAPAWIAALAWLTTMGCLASSPQAELRPRDIAGPDPSALGMACTPSGFERCFDAIDDNCNGLLDEGCGLMTGQLQFLVAWASPTADVELEVTDPSGHVALVGSPTPTGLTKQQSCPADEGCLGQNVENVFLEGSSPERGRYRVVVRLVSLGEAVGPITVQLGVRIGSESHALRFDLAPGESSSRKSLEFTL